MNDARNKQLKVWLTIISVLVLVMMVRMFCVSSHRIFTHSMEHTLSKGDFILVSKKLVGKSPEIQDVLLFKSPLYKDSLSSPLFLSRCLALPGDTFRAVDDTYYLNKQVMSFLAEPLATYSFVESDQEVVEKAMEELNIPFVRLKSDRSSISLTNQEYCTLRCLMPSDTSLTIQDNIVFDYEVIIPRSGRAYRLDSLSLPFCQEAIMTETNGQARFRNGKLYLKGKEQAFFFFKEDYYWLLADNREEGIDSRYLGLVPASKILGTAFFCWYSSDKSHRFKRID